MAKNSPFEPPADLRQFGVAAYTLFIALTEGGFTEDQALRFLGVWAANIPQANDDDS